jgi:hypothetical protein
MSGNLTALWTISIRRKCANISDREAPPLFEHDATSAMLEVVVDKARPVVKKNKYLFEFNGVGVKAHLFRSSFAYCPDDARTPWAVQEQCFVDQNNT